MKFKFLLEKKFRAGDLYRLREWSQLDSDQKESLAGLQDESEVYGVFEPQARSTPIARKVAYREVALLYFHLQHSNKLPHYLIFPRDEKINETIAALLLDGIIEIEWEGKFVSGLDAMMAIYDDDIINEGHPQTYLSQLSYRAIRYAWTLNDHDERSMASRLYAFNTVPWDASMKTMFHEKHNVNDFLFSSIDDDTMNTLNEQWHSTVTEKKEWLSWNRKAMKTPIEPQSPHIYKLYVSPLINDVPAVLARCLPAINTSDAVSFKIGNTLRGLLRPDKMVVYFYSKESLIQMARVLKESLKDFPSQGVPFSSQLDDDGLLSWGQDPGDEGKPIFETGSWRTVISDKLAAMLAHVKKNKLRWPQAIAYIEATMQTKGIDIRNWEPPHEFNN
jgi:hypothetical protein